MSARDGRPGLIVASHRGPFVYERTAGGYVGRRGGGGLIGVVAPAMEDLGGTWIAATLSDHDRERAAAEPDGWDENGYRIRMVALPQEDHALHYDVVSNEYLWFVFHYLFDVPHEPVFDEGFTRAWDGYRSINARYASEIIAAGRTEAVLVQDYHLMLVGAELRRRSRARRPLLYFHHTPWCEPDYFGIFPDAIVREVLHGLLAFDVVGFHAHRWADAFVACCTRFLPEAVAAGDTVTFRGRTTKVVAAPVPLDVPRLTREAVSERADERVAWIDGLAAGRRLLVRVDRIDLSKNPLRGFLAFERVLERDPSVARDVLFLALLYPSRSNVDSYRRYFAACMAAIRRINDRFEKESRGEGPIALHFEDDVHRGLAALRRYDALLVNPVFDGLNLVAKEGAAVNQNDGVIMLSRNAGVFEELGPASIPLHPFDVEGTADAIQTALSMPAAERAKRAKRLRRLATTHTPAEWVTEQLTAAPGV